MVEQKGADGDQLGLARLAHHVERHSATDVGTAETVRRLGATLMKPEEGLGDDATLLLVEWKGRAAGG